MGVFAGFSSTAMALVASQVPEQRLGYALGWLSTGQLVGSLIGPVIGGVLADADRQLPDPLLLHLRRDASPRSVLVWRGVHEHFVPPQCLAARRSGLRGLELLIGAAGMLPLFFVLFMAQFSTRAVQPVVTLFVQELSGHRPNLATLGGLAFSVTGLAGMMAVAAARQAQRRDRLSPRAADLPGGRHADQPAAGFRRQLLGLRRRALRRWPVHRRHPANGERADRAHGRRAPTAAPSTA